MKLFIGSFPALFIAVLFYRVNKTLALYGEDSKETGDNWLSVSLLFELSFLTIFTHTDISIWMIPLEKSKFITVFPFHIFKSIILILSRLTVLIIIF
jgi:hypothetical protein